MSQCKVHTFESCESFNFEGCEGCDHKPNENSPAELMQGIMGVAGVMMKNLHIIAKKDCECSHIAKNTLVALGDRTYAKNVIQTEERP